MCFQIEQSRNNYFSKELDLPATENKTKTAIAPNICLADLRLILDPKVQVETLRFESLLLLK